jgi:hypothetical protein
VWFVWTVGPAGAFSRRSSGSPQGSFVLLRVSPAVAVTTLVAPHHIIRCPVRKQQIVVGDVNIAAVSLDQSTTEKPMGPWRQFHRIAHRSDTADIHARDRQCAVVWMIELNRWQVRITGGLLNRKSKHRPERLP